MERSIEKFIKNSIKRYQKTEPENKNLYYGIALGKISGLYRGKQITYKEYEFTNNLLLRIDKNEARRAKKCY